jgi:VIT1/CCC1 family predicted Fe2+/Mn2+ transporter
MVLGANDGLVSIASLMLGVGAVKNDAKSMIVSGIAGLVAGACSMAIGEFVSVFSQRDSELADVEKERQVQTTTLSINTNSHLFVKLSSELLLHLCNDFQLQCDAPRAGNWPQL